MNKNILFNKDKCNSTFAQKPIIENMDGPSKCNCDSGCKLFDDIAKSGWYENNAS